MEAAKLELEQAIVNKDVRVVQFQTELDKQKLDVRSLQDQLRMDREGRLAAEMQRDLNNGLLHDAKQSCERLETRLGVTGKQRDNAKPKYEAEDRRA